MKVNRILLISLLIVGLLIPAVSSYEQTFEESHLVYGYGEISTTNVKTPYNFSVLKVKEILSLQEIDAYAYVCLSRHLSQSQIDYFTTNQYGLTSITGTIEGDIIFTGQIYYNANLNPDGSLKEVVYVIEFDNIDIKNYTDAFIITLNWDQTIVPPCQEWGVADWSYIKNANDRYSEYPIAIASLSPSGTYNYPLIGKHTYHRKYDWYNTVKITETDLYYTVNFIRGNNPSWAEITDADTGLLVYSSSYTTDDVTFDVKKWLITSGKINVTVVSVEGNAYNILYPPPGEPGEPGEPTPTMRTGTVTMTDHNGTTIRGFEVKAVNHYTGEEYTVSTETDVAVMNLPMDRTVEIRNPQTGVYEEAPVGYYRFYGQKPGYKMLNEEGVKVSVMPEKYSPYKLCEILVTSESGPLTGKHQFHLRSWSDNSILQTGTISAKSRTTGIWYNTTVTNGIATLVLPYDTSDALSEHAGQYYIYATSPGYEDIDYGVQITVYPREIYKVKSIHLYPIGGVPTPGNVTLRIQTISETGQSVDNAEIFIAGVLGAGQDVWDTYTTSWTGFYEVSVPGNSTYDIVVRAAGYYDSSKRVQVFTENPPIIEMYLFLSGAPTVEPTTEPTGWVTGPPSTQPTGGIPDEDDDSSGFLMEAVRGIGNVFGVGFATAKIILGMLLALAIGFATAKQLRGGAAEFGLGLLGGTMLGILVGLIPVWTIVVLLLVVGLYIGNRYVGGGANNG